MTTRWGIAATGGMAAAFSEDLAHVPGAEIAFVGSRSPESAADFAGRFGAGASGTYADLLAAGRDGEVDVIYVATPHPQHHDLALAAIEGGTPLLVEKAFTATLAGAQEVVDAARAAQVFCMEAMWTRFQPAVVHARELVAAGAIGDLLLVQADFCAQRDYDPSSRLFDLALGGGAVLDLGVYPVSLAQHFLGRPDRVTVTGTTYANGADRSAAIHLSYADGRAASLTTSLAAQTPAARRWSARRARSSWCRRSTTPPGSSCTATASSPRSSSACRPGAATPTRPIEVQDCLAAGRTESAVMPLADTLDVQWVLEESLRQLGIEMAEAPRGPGRVDGPEPAAGRALGHHGAGTPARRRDELRHVARRARGVDLRRQARAGRGRGGLAAGCEVAARPRRRGLRHRSPGAGPRRATRRHGTRRLRPRPPRARGRS